MTQELLGRVHRELLDVLNSINQDKIHHDGDDFHELLNDVEKALAQPEQEPVCDKDPQGCWNVRCQLGKKCKNTPPQRTEPAQQKKVWTFWDLSGGDITDAIKAKLKEKNT